MAELYCLLYRLFLGSSRCYIVTSRTRKRNEARWLYSPKVDYALYGHFNILYSNRMSLRRTVVVVVDVDFEYVNHFGVSYLRIGPGWISPRYYYNNVIYRFLSRL